LCSILFNFGKPPLTSYHFKLSESLGQQVKKGSNPSILNYLNQHLGITGQPATNTNWNIVD